jgi:hypothetical protein
MRKKFKIDGASKHVDDAKPSSSLLSRVRDD